MKEFDRIIGYDSIKKELIEMADMLSSPEQYTKMGATLPSGILLIGNPGLGKSLMATCLIQASGLPSRVVRKTKSKDFTEEITKAFEEAKKNAPSILLLDDMDKFANEDNNHPDADEYVAVQAGIDMVKGFGVFVIATVNNRHKLPDSLLRPGRFDRILSIPTPSGSDAEKIIRHYLNQKPLAPDVSIDDLCKMIPYHSCAALESILNEAAIKSAFKKKDALDMNDLIEAVLCVEYETPDSTFHVEDSRVAQVAVHEAGHALMSELLVSGSVGLVSLRKTGRNDTGGFVYRCKDLPQSQMQVMIFLAGKVAEEIIYGYSAEGCSSDLNHAIHHVESLVLEHYCGLWDMTTHLRNSDSSLSTIHAVTRNELERYERKVRTMLTPHRDLIQQIADRLREKETLLASDIASVCKNLERSPLAV